MQITLQRCWAVLLLAVPVVSQRLTSEPSATPTRGGILHVALRAEVKTFNPVVALDAPSRDVLRRIHADLISIDRQSQRTVPSLAESWTASPDGRLYTIKLRPGIKFSDGHPFTAADVVFSFQVYLDPVVRSPQRDLLLIGNKPIQVSMRDDTTVEVRLPGPYAAAERIFDSVAMLPRHKLEAAWKAGKLAQTWGLNTSPAELVGLGPFRLKQFRPGQNIELERNPFYWRKSPTGQQALPYLDGIDFRIIADEDAQLARFVNGDIDILNRLSTKAIAFLRSRNITPTDLGPGLEYNFICFNLSPNSPKLAWFSKHEFRQALSLAVDRQAMARIVYDGKAAPIWGHVSPGNRLWFSSAIARPPQSIALAQQLLVKAGFNKQPDGKLTYSDGKPVEFSILVSTSSPERQRMATLLQQDFKQLGITLTIAALEFRSLLDRVLTTRQFDACLLGLGGGDADPNPEMNVWLSSGGMHLWNPNQKSPGAPWEAELDRLMQQQMVTLNERDRKSLYDRAQKIVASELPMIFLLSPHVVVAQRGSVGNFRPVVLDHQTLWNSDQLFLRPTGSLPQ